MTVVRAALVQTTWTGDKESMIDKHEEYAREAAAQGAQVICFQELFYGPYFCQVQDSAFYEYAEAVPGPTTERFQALAKELGSSSSCRSTSEEQPGFLYNTAAVIDADGSYLGKYRKHHIPHVRGFWEKFYFRPGQPRVPRLRHRGRQGRRLHLLRPALPRGLARARSQRRPDRLQPQRHQPRPERVPLVDRAAGRRRGQRVLRRRHQPGRHRGPRRRRLLRPVLLRRPRGQLRRRQAATRTKPELIVRDLDLDLHPDGPRALGVLPRPPPGRLRQTWCGPMTTLITRRHRRLADRSGQADVLVDGETIAAVVAPGSTALGSDLASTADTRRSTRPASTSSPAGSTATPTWSCRSAAPTPRTPSRPARRRRPGAGRRRSSTSPSSAPASGSRTGSPPGTSKADGNCAIDYGFHQILGGVDDDALKAMDELVADGHHQLQAVHGLPRRLLLRRRPDPAGDAAGARERLARS